MKILLLGYGVVGSGVFEQIQKNKLRFKEEYEQDVEVVGILVNTLEKYREFPHSSLFSNNFDTLFSNDFDVLIETIGGIEPAYTYVSAALELGKSVITSNKDLIAEKGNLLQEIALKTGAQLSFEASVGGGIPVLKPLRECLASDQIIEIQGIINGTTNFILTKMIQEGLSYADALASAQKLGFAEANPTSDVEGLDAVRKISILTKLGLKISLDWKTLPVEGITNVTFEEVDYFKKNNYVVKLIGMTKRFPEGVYASVRPVVLSNQSAFASVNNEFNAIKVVGESVGELFFSGKGAGKNPTATAVLGDLVDLLQNKKNLIHTQYKTVKTIALYPEKSKWLLCLTPVELKNFQSALTSLNDEKSLSAINYETNGSQPTFIEIEDMTELEAIDYKNVHGIPNAKYYLILE